MLVKVYYKISLKKKEDSVFIDTFYKHRREFV